MVHEQWQVEKGVHHVGSRVRRSLPVPGGEVPYSVNGTVVGYLPEGEEEGEGEMFHVMHDDGAARRRRRSHFPACLSFS